MGYSTFLDIIGAFIIGCFLMLILWRTNDAVSENLYTNGGELIVQQNLVTTIEILEHDFKKIGYCKNWKKIPNPTRAILSADSTSIKFLTDVDNDGDVDSLHYYSGLASDLTDTPNPRDRILYRVINDETPNDMNMGITEFNMTYFNALGDTIDIPVVQTSEIASIEINIAVEDVAAYNENYSKAYWRQVRLSARNLRNR